MRDAVTLGAMRAKEADEESNAFYEINHVPKMWKGGSGRSQSQKALTIKSSKAEEKSLPPLKTKATDEEAEIMNLMRKNLIAD